MMRAHRLLTTALAMLGVFAGGLALTGAPAFAAAPEAPETTGATGVTATTATLHGVLNPKALAPAEAGWYFAYSTEATCTGAYTTPLESEAAVQAKAEEREVSELQPDKKYEVCLVATSEGGAASTPGNEVPLTTPAAPPTVREGSESVSGVTGSEATFGATINPNNEETTYSFEYSTEANGETLEGTIATVNGSGAFPAGEFGERGVSAQSDPVLRRFTTYYYRVAAKDAAGTTRGKVESFQTLPVAPHVSTGAVSEIEQASANVAGTVTPEGAETYYYYEYGPTAEYGQSTAPENSGVDVGAGLSAVAAPGILVPLTPGVSYHYRLVAWNETGTSYGQDKTFTAEAGQSPTVTTGPASGVTVNEASISGTINPQGKETSYRFEYGENTTYGTQAFGTVLPEQGEQTVTLNLRGIQPDTTYHYRLVVSNPGGTSYGEDMTFTTSSIAFPIIAPTPPPLIALPSFTFPTGSEPTTKPGKTKKHGKKTHGKKKHKKAKKR